MTPTGLRTVRWMVRDTFRQALHAKLFWVMLGLTGLCAAFCLSVSVDAPPERPRHPAELPLRVHPSQAAAARAEGLDIHVAGEGTVSLGWGMVSYPVARTKAQSVREIQLWLAGVLADNVGVLLALLWTAGFAPAFLEPHAVAVLLAKPVSRTAILVGKFAGVVLFVTVQALAFVGLTWLGLGAATGVWDHAYWFAVPILVAHFAAFYAFSVLLAVCTRSTVVAGFGTLLFWVLCFAVNLTRHKLAVGDTGALAPAALGLMDLGYWVLPKPLDFSGIFFDAMAAEEFSAAVPEMARLKADGGFHPELAVLTSLGFAVGLLGLAAYEFHATDY